MRICFLNHDLKPGSGAGRFGLNFIGHLRSTDSGIKSVVLTSEASSHSWEQPLISPRRLRLLRNLLKIRRIFQDSDIIHALDGWPYGALAAIAAVGTGKPLLITAIGTGAIKPLYDWRRPLLAWAYRRATRLVAISKNTRDEILLVLPDLEIEVINHAVDADEFGGDPDAGLSREEQENIAKLKPYILSVGSWKRRKGFEYSFPAFAEVKKHFPNLNYVVCGIGPKLQLTDPLKITGSVFYFKGVRWPFLRSLYRNAELFILLPVDDNKDIEGFGFAFLEAAAAGLPVVGTTNSSVEDAVESGKNGLLVPPRDSPRAAQAAIRILENVGMLKEFRKGSLDFAKRMSWSMVIDRYLSIYRDLLSK
ncbi:MAG: glycosyltransferase family 4 protein [Patescibacteria group bacterium]